MATVQQLIEEALNHEGGYVNHPADKGGPTNLGITQQTLTEYLGRPASIEDVKNLTKETATEIYVRKYLSGPRIDTLPDPTQRQIFDIAINSGPKTAVKILQRVVNAAGFGPITVDGVLGPKTRVCVENAQNEMHGYFQNAIVDERIKFYESIVANNPKQAVFLKGWKRRAESYRVKVD